MRQLRTARLYTRTIELRLDWLRSDRKASQAAQALGSEPDGDHHFRRLEVHVGHRDPGEVHEALEYSGCTHGLVLSSIRLDECTASCVPPSPLL